MELMFVERILLGEECPKITAKQLERAFSQMLGSELLDEMERGLHGLKQH